MIFKSRNTRNSKTIAMQFYGNILRKITAHTYVTAKYIAMTWVIIDDITELRNYIGNPLTLILLELGSRGCGLQEGLLYIARDLHNSTDMSITSSQFSIPV